MFEFEKLGNLTFQYKKSYVAHKSFSYKTKDIVFIFAGLWLSAKPDADWIFRVVLVEFYRIKYVLKDYYKIIQ